MNFSRLVNEWAWRVNDGMPDPLNRTHVEFLRDVLRESGYAEDFIMSYTQNLTEAEVFKATKKDTGNVSDFDTEAARDKAIKSGSHTKIGDSKPDKKKSAKVSFDRRAGTDTTKSDDKDIVKKQKITPEQAKRQQDKNDMLSDVASLITHPKNQKSGPGTHTLSADDVKIYQKFLSKTPEEQNKVTEDIKKDREEKYGPISEDDIDKTIAILKEQLGSKAFNALKSKIKGKGDPPSNAKRGDAGEERFKNVIKHYLETGGISPITGEEVPFQDSQLDHIVSLDNGGVDKPENWMWMESRFNQFKGSKEDAKVKADLAKLGYRTDKEWLLAASEKELAKFQKAENEVFWKNQFEKNGKSTGLSENNLKNLNADEVNSVVKAWNISLGETDAERESHPDFISRYPSRSATITVDGEEVSLPVLRNGNVKPIKGKPETYGLVQNPDTKEVKKNPAYDGLSDDEALKKSLHDFGTGREGGGAKKSKDEMIADLIEQEIATKSSDSESEDNAIKTGLDDIQKRANEKIQAIDKLKDEISKNPENAKAKGKIVSKAIKQWKKDNPKPDTGKKSSEVKEWKNKLEQFELEQWQKFKGEE